jgi:hypothetical protein
MLFGAIKGLGCCSLQYILLSATLLRCRLRAPGRLAEGTYRARLCGCMLVVSLHAVWWC